MTEEEELILREKLTKKYMKSLGKPPKTKTKKNMEKFIASQRAGKNA